ncbi:hypothetical protein CEE34_03040 [Candidatus Aerophobetes bacterium Ae_b3a]|nr:MAG: hypothetical protein CEE34_03040 [Candidatus Aerophobetes bacterium Ae_b3a]
MTTVLSIFGLCYLFAWCFVGLYLGFKHESHSEALESSAKKGNLADYFAIWSVWKMHAGAHAHALLLALICIIVALLMPQIGLADTAKNILGILLMVGTILASIFHWFYFKPLLGLGSIMFLIAVLMTLIGFIKGS